jgi:Cystathionine beta-lyases/cystathionine gamma-synthases
LIRGVKTMSLRLDRQNQNVAQILPILQEQPGIQAVYYPGSHSAAEAAIQQNKPGVLGLF